jgi:hypothetical protein
MMDCHEAKERLREKRRTASLDRHVARCDDCASFERELRTGGRDLAEAFLSSPPGPGFEERVNVRLREREIAVPTKPAGRFTLVLVPAAVILLAVAGWRIAFPTAPVERPPQEPAAPVTTVVPTEPRRENPLYLRIDRVVSNAGTELLLSFAGRTRQMTPGDDVETEILTAWALGARTAEVTIGPDVPSREIVPIIDRLERVGYSYSLVRGR